jgi:hypothetical protein
VRLSTIYAGAALLCGTLQACTYFVPDVRDLTLGTLSTANLQNQPEIIWLGGNHRPSIDLLRIEFLSSVDLMKRAHAHEFNIGTKIWFCDDGPDKFSFGIGHFPYLYAGNSYVSSTAADKLEANKSDEFLYHLYFQVARKADLNGLRETEPAYDLRANPRDLCLTIHGGNMIGGSFDSTVLRVPKKAISEAVNSTR